jgi:hypothetical protein
MTVFVKKKKNQINIKRDSQITLTANLNISVYLWVDSHYSYHDGK